ncbi:MAG: hypothetical protein ACRELF_19640 [Gemmataceae bacterium]
MAVTIHASRARNPSTDRAGSVTTDHSNLGGEFTLPGTSIFLKRMGYGAMQLAGPRTVEQAAREPVRLALLGPDGPTGTFSDENGVIPS